MDKIITDKSDFNGEKTRWIRQTEKKFVGLKKKVTILLLIYFGVAQELKFIFSYTLNRRDNTVHLFIFIKVVMFGIYVIISPFLS